MLISAAKIGKEVRKAKGCRHYGVPGCRCFLIGKMSLATGVASVSEIKILSLELAHRIEVNLDLMAHGYSDIQDRLLKSSNTRHVNILRRIRSERI